MAYFIVIGTDNDVKCVVDEVKGAHLQHNIITSGCILNENGGLYYHWDLFNERGDKTNENHAPIALHDALTNQISQFKTLLPQDAVPNVFIIAKCFDDNDIENLLMVCRELDNIGGAMLSNLQIDIVLIGYDLNKPGDVTIRPHWKRLESLRGLSISGRFHTDILYINNMDYMGAATNVDSHILAKFLCHWSKMVCSGNYDPKASIHSHFYAIGMSEHQYDFGDLNEFFRLAAEEKLLDRTLNNTPSSDTQALLDSNYFSKINLDVPWIDGLCAIKSMWKEYCTAEWNPSIPLTDNPYSLNRQELALASYLNAYLKLYISEEQREISKLKERITQKESEKSQLENQLKANPEENKIQEKIDAISLEIQECSRQIEAHEYNIKKNTFEAPEEFYEKYGAQAIVIEKDEESFSEAKASIDNLINYVKSDECVSIMRDAVNRATIEDTLPSSYPESDVLNIGHLKEIVINNPKPVIPQTPNTPEIEELNERPGCLSWIKSLFGLKPEKDIETTKNEAANTIQIEPATVDKISLNETLDKTASAIRKVDKVRSWWDHLCETVDTDQKRLSDCRILMNGEKDIYNKYVVGKEGYKPKYHRKSVSLIDMDKVRTFRDTDAYYQQNISAFLERWFDKSTPLENRMTMPELIKHQVLDPLLGKYHTLKWNGENPFVNEALTDQEMHSIIVADIKQSKPFVEYIRLLESNIASNLNICFFSNKPDIPAEANEFRNRYDIGTTSISPVYLEDFVNSLCVIQVLDIPDHIDALKDFKPVRETELHRIQLDIKAEAASIVADADSIEEKARAIYNWLCDNIAYDTTRQIHDAETCYKTKRGVCQAYCELFCRIAEAIGLTADIISGKTKEPDGTISEAKHAWIFVYTHAYDGILLDPTWGAGGVDGVKFIKNGDNTTWFDVSPYWMIFSHFPDQQYWSKLDITISEEQFEKLPYVCPKKETDGKDYLFETITKIQGYL